MEIPVLQLKSGREKSIINRHPWIFSGGLQKKPQAEEGDIVEVRSAKNEVLGYGFYSERSQISCRMFDWSPLPSDFENSEYWYRKLAQAHKIRESLIITDFTNAYRLIHAEGDFMPGVIIDVYDDVAVVQMLIKGVERRQEILIEALGKLGFNKIYSKIKTSSVKLEDIESGAGWMKGHTAELVPIRENGLMFKVNIEKGQKTGFFLDQRENRNLLKSLSAGKTVLNAFSYTGGFSVYALAGHAAEVHSLDISQDAIDQAEKNVKLNFPDANHSGIVSDCFEFLREMPDNFYDIIVLDPPAFAKSAKAVSNASRGYKQINMRGFQKVKPNGLVFTFSCSQNIDKDLFQKIVFSAAADAGRNVRIIQQLHQPCDHPINIFHPEGEYLKGLLLWVE